jgi:MFS family permease
MTRRYAWYVLLVLTAINFINYVDRQIIISLGPFIRHDLQLTYTGFGWLITAFMLIHSLTSLPFGMLSDRWVRCKIIAFGVWSWSAATFFCGLATDFSHLLLARAAVGIGEAAYRWSAQDYVGVDGLPYAGRESRNSSRTIAPIPSTVRVNMRSWGCSAQKAISNAGSSGRRGASGSSPWVRA